jgi:Plasmid pRiA4b ORF-3-like protein
MPASHGSVYTIKVTLRGLRPPIWRRLEVPSDIRLDALSTLVQAAFGWAGYHLWVFETERGEYGRPDPELGHRNAATVTLKAVAPRAGARLRYLYDFGDDWEHDLVVEAVGRADPDASYPRCTGGRRAGPPEDCGGIWGYADLLEILADPQHEEHEERLEWLGLESAEEFDPAAFDLAEINEDLGAAAPR